DAFGVEVAKRLALRQWPDEVRVTDFGIRGFDLALALLDDFEAVILVDATRRGGTPGTLYLLEHEMGEASATADPLRPVDTHGMDPLKVLWLVETLGGRVRRLLIVGCEPAEISTEQDMEMGLSEPVRAVLDEAVSLIESLVERILRGESVTQARAG